jgi:hypothetical protein
LVCGLTWRTWFEVDDGRAVDALEHARIEPAFKVLHRFAQDQRIVGGADAHVIARRFDAFDRIDIDAEDLAAILDVDQLFIARGTVRLVRHRLHGIGRDFGQHDLELFRFFGGQRFSAMRVRTRSSVSASLSSLHRLHQVVDGVGLERAHGVFLIGGDEDEQRRLDLHHAL